MPQPLTAAVRYLSGEREPVRVATTGNINLQGIFIVDDVELEVADRVLVKDQTDQRTNGIYLASEGRWFRAPDASYTRSINQGVTVHVQEGSVNHDRTYRFDSQNPVVGNDAIIITYWLSDTIVDDIQEVVDGAAEAAAALATAGAQAAIIPLIAQAQAAAESASDYADFARNNWAVIGPFTGRGEEGDYLLSMDPGSENNMFVIVGGVSQMVGSYALIRSGEDAFIRINVPDQEPFEVRVSNAIPVGTPSDGSVTEAKLASQSVTAEKLVDGSGTTEKHADNSVTFGKMQDIATLRLLGRATAGSGDPEEITAAKLRDLFLPSGSVIDSKYSPTNGNTATTALMPYDNTLPQRTEGTEFLSASITPKSSTNKLRIRFRIGVTCSAVDNVVWGIFSSASLSALAAGYNALPASGYGMNLVGEVEFLPGSTAPVTISVRVGSGAGSTVTLNGAVNLGGANTSTLVIEEIKA